MITDEIKAKIACNYIGQNCKVGIVATAKLVLTESTSEEININTFCKNTNYSLLLRDTTQLTEEEKLKVCKIQGYNYSEKENIQIYFDHSDAEYFQLCIMHSEHKHDNYECVELCTAQYLYSIGIALPYTNYSVEDLVKEGVYLIQK